MLTVVFIVNRHTLQELCWLCFSLINNTESKVPHYADIVPHIPNSLVTGRVKIQDCAHCERMVPEKEQWPCLRSHSAERGGERTVSGSRTHICQLHNVRETGPEDSLHDGCM